MNIYFAHPRNSTFRDELYAPLLASDLVTEHNFVLPHAESDLPFSTKDSIATFDLVIAEVSEKATGIGIELGWANSAGVPIACIYKRGVERSRSLSTVCSVFEPYEGPEELIAAIRRCLNHTWV